MHSEEKMINGVDISELSKMIDNIKENSALAMFKMHASNKWLNGAHSQATIKDFFGACREFEGKERMYDMDEPPVLLGEDQGANPVQFLLVALSGCLTTALVAHASASGIHLKSIESRYEGDLDIQGFLGLSENAQVGYQQIRVFFKINADISEDEKKDLVTMAQKYSPVFNTISKAVPVAARLEE